MLLIVAAGVVADIVRRFITGAEPTGLAIVAMALIATVINIYCLWLLSAHRVGDVNLCATWTFSVNDHLSNLGALLAGGLVVLLGRAWPDLVIGLCVAVAVAMGGVNILRDAWRTRREQDVLRQRRRHETAT